MIICAIKIKGVSGPWASIEFGMNWLCGFLYEPYPALAGVQPMEESHWALLRKILCIEDHILDREVSHIEYSGIVVQKKKQLCFLSQTLWFPIHSRIFWGFSINVLHQSRSSTARMSPAMPTLTDGYVTELPVVTEGVNAPWSLVVIIRISTVVLGFSHCIIGEIFIPVKQNSSHIQSGHFDVTRYTLYVTRYLASCTWSSDLVGLMFGVVSVWGSIVHDIKRQSIDNYWTRPVIFHSSLQVIHF